MSLNQSQNTNKSISINESNQQDQLTEQQIQYIQKQYKTICEFVQQIVQASYIETSYMYYIDELKILILDIKNNQLIVNQEKLKELQEGAQQLIDMRQNYEDFQKLYKFETVETFEEDVQEKILQLKNLQLQQASLIEKSIQMNFQEIKNQDQIYKIASRINENFTNYQQILTRINLFVDNILDNFNICIYNLFGICANKLNITVEELVAYIRNIIKINIEQILQIVEKQKQYEITELQPQEFILSIVKHDQIIPEALYKTYTQQKYNIFDDIQLLLQQIIEQFEDHKQIQSQLLDSYDQKTDNIHQNISTLQTIEFDELYEAQDQYNQYVTYMQQLRSKSIVRYELMVSVLENRINQFVNQVIKMQQLYTNLQQIMIEVAQQWKQQVDSTINVDICYVLQRILLQINQFDQKLTQYLIQCISDQKEVKIGIQQLNNKLQQFDLQLLFNLSKQAQNEMNANNNISNKSTNNANKSIGMGTDIDTNNKCIDTVTTQKEQEEQQAATTTGTTQNQNEQSEQQQIQSESVRLSALKSTLYSSQNMTLTAQSGLKFTVPSSIDYNNQQQQKMLQMLFKEMKEPQLCQLCDAKGQQLYPTHYKIHKFFDCLTYTNKAGKYVPIRFNSIQEVTTKTVKSIPYGVRIQPKFGQQINFSFTDRVSRDKFYCTVETLRKFQNKVDIIIAMVYQ